MYFDMLLQVSIQNAFYFAFSFNLWVTKNCAAAAKSASVVSDSVRPHRQQLVIFKYLGVFQLSYWFLPARDETRESTAVSYESDEPEHQVQRTRGCDIHALHLSFIGANKSAFSWFELGFYQSPDYSWFYL